MIERIIQYAAQSTYLVSGQFLVTVHDLFAVKNRILPSKPVPVCLHCLLHDFPLDAPWHLRLNNHIVLEQSEIARNRDGKEVGFKWNLSAFSSVTWSRWQAVGARDGYRSTTGISVSPCNNNNSSHDYFIRQSASAAEIHTCIFELQYYLHCLWESM